MKWVLLFFCGILGLMLLLLLLIISAKIKLNIQKFYISNIEKDAKIIKKIKPIKVIKRLRPKLEKLKLYLAIGTENVMLTVNLVTLISSLIRNKHTKCRTWKSKTRYRIWTLYRVLFVKTNKTN